LLVCQRVTPEPQGDPAKWSATDIHRWGMQVKGAAEVEEKSKTYCGKRNGYEFKFSANDPKVLQQLPPEVRI
jgi:hypothetical protein